MRPPRGSTRSSKYVVEKASASEGTGKIDFVMAKGVDNATLGQVSVVDVDVPTGGKIKLLDIRISYASLTNVATFVHWTIQHLEAQQSSIDPLAVGGSSRRKNVMLSGIKSVGFNQNSDMHIRYKIPKSMWRMADDVQWLFVTNSTQVFTTVKEVVYKVFM